MVDPVADVAAILAVLVGTAAAIYAWRADRFSRRTHSRDIEPRVRLAQFDGKHYLLGNAGGSAPIVLLLVLEADGTVRALAYTGLPAMTPAIHANYAATIGHIAPTGQTPRAILIAAKDIELRWWDCMAGKRIKNFNAWWSGQLQTFGLPPWVVEEHSGGMGYKLNRP